VFYFFLVIERLEFAVWHETVEGVFVIFDVIDEEFAVEMIDLVLQDTCEKTFGRDSKRSTIDVEGSDTDFGVAGDFAVDVRDTETPFWLEGDVALVFDDLRIDEDRKISVFVIIEIIANDDHASEVADLYASKAHTDLLIATGFPITSGVDHIEAKLTNFRRDDTNTLRAMPQAWFRQRNDVVFGHRHIGKYEGVTDMSQGKLI